MRVVRYYFQEDVPGGPEEYLHVYRIITVAKYLTACAGADGYAFSSIEEFLCESDASTLVIGEAKIDSALSAFRQGTAQSCARHVEQNTSVEVVVVTPAE